MKKLIPLCLIFLCGCPFSSGDIITGVNKVGPTIVYDILTEETTTKNAATVKADAKMIADICTNAILPLFTNNTLSASALIAQIKSIFSKQITNTKYLGSISSIITLATINIDLTAPTMTPLETSYLLASVNAINKGCTAYATGKMVKLTNAHEVNTAYFKHHKVIPIEIAEGE